MVRKIIFLLKSKIIFFPKKLLKFASKKNSGFSLIELLFVVSLISVIGTIALPSVQNLVNKYKKDSYINELVSFLELAKRETRRYGMSCKILINEEMNLDDKSKEAFEVSCSGNNDYTKKVYLMVPKLDVNLIQKVSGEINITPRGQILSSVENSSNSTFTVVFVSLKGDYSRDQIYPSCIVINQPSGVISTGKYEISSQFFELDIKNEYSNILEESRCQTN